jgi:hypothetical protein
MIGNGEGKVNVKRRLPAIGYGRSMLSPARLYARIKSDFKALAHGEPGRRFIDHHELVRKREKGRASALKSAAYILAGVLLLLIGVVLSIPPGLPGFLIWVPALGLLVARLRFFAVWLDRAEVGARRAIDRLRR